MRNSPTWLLIPALVTFSVTPIRAAFIDFEDLPDGTILTSQYPGLTFSNAIIRTAGISLDESVFPPLSGFSVAFDNGGPMTITFSTPVLSVKGRFTHSTTIRLAAFDADGVYVLGGPSPSVSNTLYPGVIVPYFSPNEISGGLYDRGISKVTITGAPAGGSFAMDNLEIEPLPEAISEPGTWILMLMPAAIWLRPRFRSRRARGSTPQGLPCQSDRQYRASS